ncbi:hypothetical protein KUTeg_014096 [Tegillarca granosa]|uniref:lysoplasmalogenase n=2 Tax=Tegillarca granosa TaxID=220873 RepID=A0ABQ9F022_TEGGR|nr:hypothetical protein KUTeg_014096 [Tegillarca granosa]
MTNTTLISGEEENINAKTQSNRYTMTDIDKLWKQVVRRMKDKYLAPFYFFTAFYYITYTPFWDYPPATLTAALVKVLPIWSLVLYVKLNNYSNTAEIGNLKIFFVNFFQVSDYSKFILVGLLFSSLGDAFLISRYTLFIPGMIAFAFAHAFYMHAMPPGHIESRFTQICFLCGVDVYLFISSGIQSVFMHTIVVIYTFLIFLVGWKALTNFEKARNVSNLASAIGIVLFIFSDFIIAVDKWKFSVPFSQCIVMTSYYASQYFLALSTGSSLKIYE